MIIPTEQTAETEDPKIHRLHSLFTCIVYLLRIRTFLSHANDVRRSIQSTSTGKLV